MHCVSGNLDLKDVLVLLVGQARVLEVCETHEVRDQQEREEQGVVCGLDSVMHDCECCQRIKEVTYTCPSAKRTDKLLGNRLYIAYDS